MLGDGTLPHLDSELPGNTKRRVSVEIAAISVPFPLSKGAVAPVARTTTALSFHPC